LAANLSNAESIIIPEAGQGVFGPSFLPSGNESPHRGTHPGFSRRLSAFFREFWGREFLFEYPQLWRTKGEVLSILKSKNLHSGWEATMSCSRDQRDVTTTRGKRVHCGICTGCFLRRLSAFTAGLPDSDENYFCGNLSAPTLEQTIVRDAARGTTSNDSDIAFRSIMLMEEFARLSAKSESNSRLMENLSDAFDCNTLQLNEKYQRLRYLLAAHAAEWRVFTQSLGKLSWVNQEISLI
jgi:hypothetical protein